MSLSIESTPRMVALAYEKMRRNLDVIRVRSSAPMTLADKILLGHSDNPDEQIIDPGQAILALTGSGGFTGCIGTDGNASIYAN